MTDSNGEARVASGGGERPLLGAGPARAVRRVTGALLRIHGALGVIAMAALAVLLITQVVVRYVLPFPLFWVEEVARLAMIWMTMLGVAYALGRGVHLTVTALVGRLPAEARRWIGIVVLMLIAVIGVVLSIASVELMDELGAVTASSSNVPRGVFFLASVIGYGFAVLQAVLVILGGTIPGAEHDGAAAGEEGAR